MEATIYPPPVPLLSTTTLPLFSTFVTGTIFNFIIHFAVLYEFGMEMGSLLLQFGEYFVKSIFPRCHVSFTNWKGNDRKKIIKSFLLLLYQLGVNQVCHIWRVDTGHWSGEVSSWQHGIMSLCQNMLTPGLHWTLATSATSLLQQYHQVWFMYLSTNTSFDPVFAHWLQWWRCCCHGWNVCFNFDCLIRVLLLPGKLFVY